MAKIAIFSDRDRKMQDFSGKVLPLFPETAGAFPVFPLGCSVLPEVACGLRGGDFFGALRDNSREMLAVSG